MQQGWICLHRTIQDNWLWESKPFSRGQAWIDLILSANHEDRKLPLGNELIILERGSLITSEMKLADRWGWSRHKIRDFFELLERDGMIVVKADNKRTIINIVNYSLYQDMPDSKGTTEEPQKDIKRTTEGHQKDTNNNVNNDNNIINNIYVSAPAENSLNDGAQIKKSGKDDLIIPAEKSLSEGAQSKKAGKGEYTADFEKFWSIYPKKVVKKAAFKEWNRRLKDKASPEDLINAAENYALHCKRNATAEQFIMHPSTFLGKDEPFKDYIKPLKTTYVKSQNTFDFSGL